jgi:hypothetical protein
VFYGGGACSPCWLQNYVQVAHRAGGKSALGFPVAAGQSVGVRFGNLHRPQFGQEHCAEQRLEVLRYKLAVALMGSR